MLQILSALAVEVASPSQQSLLVLAPALSQDRRWKTFLEETELFQAVVTSQHLSGPGKWIKRYLKWTRRYAPEPWATKWRYSLLRKKFKEFYALSNLDFLEQETSMVDVYYGSPDTLTEDLIEYLRLTVKHVTLYGLDEGLASYLTGIHSVYGSVKAAYLFEPDLADGDYEKRPLLKLDAPELADVRALFKKHFADSILSVNRGGYFFDQWAYMPCFHRPNVPGWERNTYITLKDRFLEQIKARLVTTKSSLFYLPHPMQTAEATEHYLAKGLTVVQAQPSVPFECALWDGRRSAAPALLLTVFSSAVVMPLFAFGNTTGIRAVFLSALFKEDPQYAVVSRGPALEALLERIKAKWPDNVYIPETPEALERILDETFVS